MSALTILTKARELIAETSQWTQGAMARDAAGEPIDPRKPEADCRCALGAIHCAAVGECDDDFDAATWALETACTTTGCGASITGFNDSPKRSHAEVLAVLGAAIESLKGDQ